MNYRLVEVTTAGLALDFYRVPSLLFGKDSQFVAVPDQMQAAIFDPKKNKHLQHIRLKRWILLKDEKVAGRIAVFDHPKPANDEVAGAIGFFDCINDGYAASLLFDTAESQLLEWGVVFVDGPIQPGENDRFWGLLVEGFKRTSFGTNWNPPYYRAFFEQAGYVPYYDQITNYIRLPDGLPERFFKIAAWVRQKGKVHVSHLQFSKKRFYAQAVADVYNNAWNQFENYKEKSVKDVLNEMQQLGDVLKEDLVWFAHIEGEAAAFMMIIPDLNQYFAKLNGRLNVWGKLKFWLMTRWSRPQRLKIVVLGVHQKYQKLGLESVLIEASYRWVKKHYPTTKEVELAWVGDFNEPMLAIHMAAGAQLLRRHITFRKSLHDDVQVKKFEIKTS